MEALIQSLPPVVLVLSPFIAGAIYVVALTYVFEKIGWLGPNSDQP